MRTREVVVRVSISALILGFAAAIGCELSRACNDTEKKSAICWALCRKDQYDHGWFDSKKNRCLCGRFKDFQDYSKPTLPIESLQIDNLDR